MTNEELTVTAGFEKINKHTEDEDNENNYVSIEKNDHENAYKTQGDDKINEKSIDSPVEVIHGLRGRTSSRRPEETNRLI